MPYKHIATYLNKTELACRLHYHHISRGSNRRKRNLSCSSTMSDYSQQQQQQQQYRGRSMSVEGRLSPISQFAGATPPSGSPSRAAAAVRLPSIMDATHSQNLPAILPKPSSGCISVSSMGPASAPAPSHAPAMYPEGQRPLPVLQDSTVMHRQQHALLKLDTAVLPSVSAPSHNASHVDLSRLHQIYASHRNTFWAAIASEYGYNAAPSTLEKAWKTGRCCGHQKQQQHQQQGGQSPLTPSDSPKSEVCSSFSSSGEWRSPDRNHDRTSISSILGPDGASTRSAWDRDTIRRMEIS